MRGYSCFLGRRKPFMQFFIRSRRLFSSIMTQNNPSQTSSIQALYDLCNNTFTSSAPLSTQSQPIHKLSSLLDTLGPNDVGLKEENPEDDRGHGLFGVNLFNRVDRWAQPITYIDIHESNSFTMCVFCFPTSAVIPLHDHPGMTVLSKMLYGSMHVKGYDWVEPKRVKKISGSSHSTVRLAKLSVDKVLTSPCGTSVLYPNSGGNLHCFTAITPCAILDVLAPPYLESAGRRCTYYRDYPYSTFVEELEDETGEGKDEEYAWLEEIGAPDDFYMRTGRYTGPPIQT